MGSNQKVNLKNLQLYMMQIKEYRIFKGSLLFQVALVNGFFTFVIGNTLREPGKQQELTLCLFLQKCVTFVKII